MLRWAWSELRFRAGRAFALLAAILFTTCGFILLTASAKAARLQTVGTVRSNSRAAYDILVRPPGAQTALEQSSGLVQPNFLADSQAGITLAQYQKIRALPGVQVAAPVAVVGYVLQTATIPIDVTGYLSGAQPQALRITAAARTDHGLTEAIDSTGYVYAAAHPQCSVLAGGRVPGGPFVTASRATRQCVSTAGHPRVVVMVPVSYPFLLAAVDPSAEAQLAGVDSTIDSGRYLSQSDGIVRLGQVGGPQNLSVPVVLASRPYTDDSLQVTVTRLAGNGGQVAGSRFDNAGLARLAALPGVALQTTEIPASQTLHTLIQQLPAQASAPRSDAGYVLTYWTAGPTQSARDGTGALTPRTTTVPDSTWASDAEANGWAQLPIDASDTAFRALTQHRHIGAVLDSPLIDLYRVGTFDPNRIPGFSALNYLPLGTYGAPQAQPGDATSNRLLGGANLLPNANIAGYLPDPPLMLTTLSALPAFQNVKAFTDVTTAGAPITAIRVRAADVTGVDSVSRERVRVLAQLIHDRTGLSVDITTGSSPSAVKIRLAAGRYGRPALTLNENWVHKGVALAILNAVDRKSVALFALVIAVCGLFVGNAASAATRARRTEYALLGALGWSRGRIAAAALYELAAIGLVAGAGGAVISVLAADATGLKVSALVTALAVPGALVVALLAGLRPALSAPIGYPGAALSPAVAAGRRRGRHTHSVTGMGIAAMMRVPGRSALGAAAVAVGTAALTIILAITNSFRGTVVGSLLGDAVTLQVRGADLAAVVGIILLGALAVADIGYLNVRERAAEYTVLRCTGWQEATIARLIVTEIVGIAALGALIGAAAGLAATAELANRLPGGTISTTVIAGAVSVAVAALAGVIPIVALRRLPPARLLAQD
ncbi:MAG TPA: FtsX-like permease family protein [Jatrophihabitans sp.]|nr:FtsX-like permease family protein [Jatrophihabitans sp.]